MRSNHDGTIVVNKYDALFAVGIVLFFFSQNTFPIPIIAELFALLERIKFKFIFAFACTVLFWGKHNVNSKIFLKETALYLGNLLILVMITILGGTLRGIRNDLFSETLHFLVPIVYAYSYINAKDGDVESALDIAFYILMFGFVIHFFPFLTPANILSISFKKSFSPFESGLAYPFMLYVWYYKWKRVRWKEFVALILCALSFKRLMLVVAVLAYFLPDLKINIISSRYKWNFKYTRRVIIIIFLLIPIVIQIIYSDWFSQLFTELTGLDFYSFASGRSKLINTAVDHYPMGGGLGSVRLFLTRYFADWYHYNDVFWGVDMHCDILRFYLEGTLVGLYSVVGSYFHSTVTDKSLILMSCVFLSCCTTHMFGYGAAMFWIIFYIMIYYFNYQFDTPAREGITTDENSST